MRHIIPAPVRRALPALSTRLASFHQTPLTLGPAALWALRLSVWVAVTHGLAWLGFLAALLLNADPATGAFWGGAVGGIAGARLVLGLERAVATRERTRPPF